MMLVGAAALQAQVPPSLGVGSRIRVTSADGSTYTGVVAPKPSDPLWSFVSADGKPINFRLHELLSVRMLGREVTLTPGWSYSAQAFPWAAVQSTDGQSLELGINRWPGFTIVRDDTGKAEVNSLWINRLSAVAAVTQPATKPGLAVGSRARVRTADGGVHEGAVSLQPGQRDVFAFVRLDTKDQWKVRLQDIHRLTKTGRTDAGLDVVEVEARDGQVYTVAVYSRSAFDLERADTGEREVNVQSRAAFRGIEALGASEAGPPAAAAFGFERASEAPASAARVAPAATPIEVTVIQEGSGELLAGALVHATDGRRSLLDTADVNGLVTFSLPDGAWVIRAKGPRGGVGSGELTVVAEAVTAPIRVAVRVRR